MYVIRLFGPLLRQNCRAWQLGALLPLCRAADIGASWSRRHVATDDTTDRFRHVSESLPRQQATHDGPEFTYQSAEPLSDESAEAPSGSFDGAEKPKIDKAAIKSIPLETIEDAVLKFVPETIRESSLGTLPRPCNAAHLSDDEFLTPGQAFYLENRDKLFEQLRRRYFEATSEGGSDQVTDGEIESLLPLLMEEEQFGSYDPDPVVSPGKHHLWDYNTSEVAATRRNVHLRKGEMPTLQQVVDILEQVSTAEWYPERSQERMTNVVVVDMDSCNRRDQAMYCIVATGTTKAHCSVLVGELLVHRGEGLQLVLDALVLLVLGVEVDAEHAAAVALHAHDFADNLRGRCDILEDGLMDAGEGPVPGPHAELLAAEVLGEDGALRDEDDVLLGLLLELDDQASVDAADVGHVHTVGHEDDDSALLEGSHLDLLAVREGDVLDIALELGVAAGLDVYQALGNLLVEGSDLVLADDLLVD
ncbi:oligomerization domain-containing protein, putative [Babesia ovata]|uniref:Oligomerization domain-containing protein, putative n=1 Tax=Babesia ovata TaxID=189622 RepID=A0A2H6K6I7_9APIC|nr:oligomerization domain-containing protein, putative [Babesia ovata]GBE58588.1 oligomerization domain-containing protein, putative [Babesia ovata]